MFFLLLYFLHMKIGKTLYVTTRKDWRAWLRKYHKTAPDIWLIYYRKASGKPRIGYNEAVEEALCYGWIDSIVKGIDDEKFAQRFSPRKKTSMLSPLNRERLHKLIKQKKMTKAGLEAVAHAYKPAKKTEKLVIPPDILKPLKANKEAWKHFQKFPESYKRVRIAYIDTRRRHSKDMFERALRNFIKKTEQNKRIGIAKT